MALFSGIRVNAVARWSGVPPPASWSGNDCICARCGRSIGQMTVKVAVAIEHSQRYTRDVKMEVSIPDTVFHAAESMASRMGMSRSEFYRRAVEDYIKSRGNGAVCEDLNAVYGEESLAVDDALARMQLTSLPDEDW